MATLPFLQLYVADYLADTVHLETDEHGAYLLIIMNYWQTEKPVPASRLQKISRLSSERWSVVERTLIDFFTVSESDCWVHERIELDLKGVQKKRKSASKAGKRSAEVRRIQAAENKEDLNGRSTRKEKREKRKEKNKKISAKKFARPTIKQIQEFIELKKLSTVDAEIFFNHYEQNEWMVGRNKMKSWKLALQGWETRNKKTGQNNAKNKSTGKSSGDIFEEGTRDAYDND